MMDSAATAVSGGGGGGYGYPDSVESSPRSRASEPWDDPFSAAPAAASSRLRLMCSYGGRIVPRPTDKSLCYLGGETRIVVVDRHSSLAELTAKLSRSLLSGRPFSLKYQLPNEDLDSLISVTTDEDLENMIEEHDRLAAAAASSAAGGVVTSTQAAGGGGAAGGPTRSNRLRLFLFPAKSESAPSSIGSLLDESKSTTWFVDALNSAMDSMGVDGLPRGFSVDAASVNCLLGLEDDSSVHSRDGAVAAAAAAAAVGIGAGVGRAEHEKLVLTRPDSSGKLARHGQDIHSVPDSPMLDTSSSFGSTSSAPSLHNLPPICLRPDERLPDPRIIVGLDDHFSQMNLSSAAAVAAVGQRPDEGYKESVYAAQTQPPPSVTYPTGTAGTPTISPTGNPNRNMCSDDEKSDHGGSLKLQSQPLPNPTQLDSTMTDSVPRPMHPNANADPKRDLPVSFDPSYRVAMPISDSAGYVLQQEQFQQPPPLPNIQHHNQQQHQQPQQQYIPANPQYIHHAATGTVLPIQSYYPITAAHPNGHPYDQQIPMYYLQARPPPYNLATMQPALMNPSSIPTSGKPAMGIPRAVATKPELQTSLYGTAVAAPPPGALQPQLIHVAADQAHSYAGMGYHVVQQHHLPQAPAPMANYGYEYAADPTNPRVYYSQATSSPALPPQYRMVSSTTATGDATVAAGDAKAARAS